MSETKRRLVVENSGQMFIEETSLYATTFPEKILERFANNISLKLPQVFDFSMIVDGFGCVGAVLTKNTASWLVNISHLRFRCPVAILADGKTVSPDFNAGKLDNDQVDLFWTPPWDNMSLWFAMDTQPVSRYDYALNGKCHLFACDDHTQITYRLPTSNVYEDCTICMGNHNAGASSHLGVVQKCLQQFRDSSWNSDLLRSKLKEAQQLFQFLPKEEGEGFMQIMPVTNSNSWQPLCDKVGNYYIANLIQQLGKAMRYDS